MEDPGSSMLQVVLLLGLLALSALFSGSETAFFALSPFRLRELTDNGNNKAQKVSILLERPDRLLTTLLVGNTAVNIAFTSLMTVIIYGTLGSFFSDEITGLITTLLTTILLLIFGEVTPKALAAHSPENFSFFVVKVIQIISLIFKPVIVLVNGFSFLILKAMGEDQQGFNKPVVTEEIIKTAVTIGEEEGTVEKDEKAMIYGIFKSTDIPVKNIMVKQQDMLCLSQETTLKEAVHIIMAEGFSRLPVYQSTAKEFNIIGILYAKDVIPYLREKRYQLTVDKVMREAFYCSADKQVSTLLAEMRQYGNHIALVKDKSERIIGLVTLEDLLEEIVGDIIDEYDYEELRVAPVGGDAPC